MLAQARAVEPDFGQVVDCSEMDQLAGGWLRRGQDEFDAIPADSGVVAEVVELGVPGEACSGGAPGCLFVHGGRGVLCFGIGGELPGLIDCAGLGMGLRD